MAETREYLRVAFAGNDGADDRLPGRAHHVSEYLGELEVHLHQRLLHALYPAALFGEQQLTLPHYRAHHADFAGRPPGRAQQSETHELLQPLTVLHVALAAGDILHLARIDEPDCEPALLEYLVHWYPVDSGGFQRHGVDAAREQPVGHRVQVSSHRAEFAHRLVVSRPGDCHPVAGRAHVNRGGVWIHLIVFPPAHGHGVLPAG